MTILWIELKNYQKLINKIMKKQKDKLNNLYKIKPLKWKNKGNDYYSADTIFGSYNIGKTYNPSRFEKKYEWSYCFDEYYDEGRFYVNSIAEAKQAALAEWVSRISLGLKKVNKKQLSSCEK